MSSLRLENYYAKKINEIFHKVRITYKLYSLKEDGSIRNCLGTNESLDTLLNRHGSWVRKGDKYVIRKAVIEVKEEPVFKVIPMNKRVNTIKKKKKKSKAKKKRRRTAV